jgi:hypothetical protein
VTLLLAEHRAVGSSDHDSLGPAGIRTLCFLVRRPLSWEPPIGIEPMTYALRGGLNPSSAVHQVTSPPADRALRPRTSNVIQVCC